MILVTSLTCDVDFESIVVRMEYKHADQLRKRGIRSVDLEIQKYDHA